MAPIPKNFIEPDIDFEPEIETHDDNLYSYHSRQKQITTKYNILITLIKTLVILIIIYKYT